MFLKLYKGTGPMVILVVLITAGLVWLGTFLDPVKPSLFIGDNPMPGWDWISGILEGLAGLSLTIALIISLLTAFTLVWLNTWLFFINARTLMPATIYLLVTGVFINLQILHPALLSMPFLLGAIKRIIDGYRKPGIGNNFFDAGLLIAAGSLLYANLIWYGIIIIIGIFLFRTFNARDLFLAIAGMVTPYLLLFSVYYISGYSLETLWEVIEYNLFNSAGEYYWTRPVIAASVFIALLLVFSLLHLMAVINSKKIRSRKIFLILFWLLLISFIIYFTVPSAGLELIFIGGIPAALVIAHYLVILKNRRLTALLFGILWILVFLVQIMRHSW